MYLNPDNLFSGLGPVNQIIGFSADKVREFGEELLGYGETEIGVLDVYKKVMELVYGAANTVKADPGAKEHATNEINSTVWAALGSYGSQEHPYASADSWRYGRRYRSWIRL